MTAPDSRARRPYGLIERLLFAMVAAGVVLTLLSFLGRYHWLAELLTHFRMQGAIGATILLAVAGLRRKATLGVLSLILAIGNALPMAEYLLPGPAVDTAGSERLRILSANVGLHNENYPALRDAIQRVRPDIIGLLEADAGWADALHPLRSEYPYAVLRPQDGAYGLVLFSRFPINERPGSPYVEEGFQTSIQVDVDWHGRPFQFVLTHLMAPSTPARARMRNTQMRYLATLLDSTMPADRILIGDLNITPWSPIYHDFERVSGMRNVAQGRGYHATWPAVAWPLAIPIDHCLVGGTFEVNEVGAGPRIGSDHRPLVVTLSTRAPQVLIGQRTLP